MSDLLVTHPFSPRLLEGLWEQLLSLFADLNNRVGLDGAPKPPQLRSCMQWWPVFEGACQLLQGGAQAAIACRMSAAAAAPLMAVNNLLQAVGIMFGCRASPLAPAQHAAVIACQLNARAALLLLAEASGWLSQINIMSKAHVAFLIPAIMDLNSAAVPGAPPAIALAAFGVDSLSGKAVDCSAEHPGV